MSLTKINADVMDMSDAYTFTGAVSGASTILQIVNVQTGAMATGTTVTPFDDTIPQNDEGNEIMTLAVTPTSATSRLKIDVNAVVQHTALTNGNISLYQDSTAGALASVNETYSANNPFTINFSHNMVAGTTSETTFKVRFGGNASGTMTFNGRLGARKYGGVFASSITITEYTP